MTILLICAQSLLRIQHILWNWHPASLSLKHQLWNWHLASLSLKHQL
ncbi:MAG: hypothetical protein F6K41_27620 [Symploca sp. SIO3E6]|nr:hypothetical protein [Caldora sp. SIO3E6]